MRTKDITAGEVYGYRRYPNAEPVRVRVVEFGISRTAYSGSRDYRGHTVKDGILVEMVDENGETIMRSRGGEHKVVKPEQNLGVTVIPAVTEWVANEPTAVTDVARAAQLEPWEDAQKSIEHKALRRASVEMHNDAFRKAHSRLQEGLKALGVKTAWSVTPTGSNDYGEGWQYTGTKLSLEALEALASLVEDAR